MNVYDSARMAELLAPLGYRRAAAAEDADLVILNTCHIREKAAEKVFSELGRIRALKQRKARRGGAHADRRRRLRRPGRGRRDPAAARRLSIWSSARRPITGCRSWWRGPARGGGGVIDTDFPGEPKFDHLPPARQRHGGDRLSDRAGRLRQVLHLLRRALYPRRRVFAPGGADPGRGARTGRIGRARDHAAGPERQRLSRRGPRWPGMGPRRLCPRARRARRARPHPLHHLASARCRRAADRRPSRRAAADAVSASAGAERLRPRPGGDEPAPHRRATTAASSGVCARRAPTWRCPPISSSAFPARARRISAPPSTSSREVGFAQAFSFKYSPRPGTPGGGAADQVPEPVKAERLAALQALLARAAARASTRPASAASCRCCSKSRAGIGGQLVGRSPYLQSVHARAPPPSASARSSRR